MAVEILDKGACKAAGFGQFELLCLGTVLRAGAPGNRTVQFFQPDPVATPEQIQIETFNPADTLEEMSVWFAFFRIEGGSPEIVPPPPPA